MNEPQVVRIPAASELDAKATEAAAGGTCTGSEMVGITESLIQAYDNLVDFTSHVIERVVGS